MDNGGGIRNTVTSETLKKHRCDLSVQSKTVVATITNPQLFSIWLITGFKITAFHTNTKNITMRLQRLEINSLERA